MNLVSGQFDLCGLSRRADEVRVDRRHTWSQVSRDIGVAASTIRRFATASDAEADGVLALIGWIGCVPEDFVVDSKVAGTPLIPAGDGVIRIDMSRLVEMPGWPRQARVGTRTTIQRLVAAAQGSDATIASLTRWSPI